MLTLKPNSSQLGDLLGEIQRMESESLVDEEFLMFSRSIVADSPFRENDQLRTILGFVSANVRYQPDPVGVEMLTSPHRMMELIGQNIAFGDCDCIALFLTCICRALGYDAHVVLIDQSGNGYNHAGVEAYSRVTGYFLYMDPTITTHVVVASEKLKDDGNPLVQYKTKLEVP